MADGTTLSTPVGVGDKVATDDLGAFGKAQWVKLMDGTDGGTALIAGDAANGLDVDVTRLPSLPAGANAIGKLAANSGVDIGDVDVTSMPGTAADGAASLPATQPVVAGWDGTNVQALATDASGILQVDVVGDSATQAGAAARTADFDTGAGTVTTVFNGIALPANGGPVAGGTSTNPLKTDPTGTTAQPVTDNGGSLTVDNGGTFAVQIAANSSVNVAQMAGTTTDVNSGVKSAGTQRVVLATDQPALTNALKVDGSAVTQPVSGTVTINAIPAGNNNIGDVDIASIAAGNNNIGDVDVASIAAGTNAIGNVGIVPRTTGGLTTFHLVSAATTNLTNLKASAGQVFGWYIYNSNAAARKVAFHNNAGSPTAGASIFFSLVIPPTSAANVFTDTGIAFSTGIAISTVTDLTDGGTTAVAANDLIINIWFG